MSRSAERLLSSWLLACCALVLLVLASGGVTRLTRSGLSIVEWKPVLGVLPPITEARWQGEFEKYQRTPEYLQVNPDMGLEGFKSIYWMEWTHRLLARLAGLAFACPFFYLLWRRRLDARWTPRLLAIAALWALQGVLGWFMVASGLVDVPRVSAYRLTAHLATACALFGLMLWTALDARAGSGRQAPPPSGLRRFAGALTALLVLTILSGGLVAGTKAGFIYNTFPKMAGRWVPPLLLERRPLPVNFFENEITVQFDHRVLALALALAVAAFWGLSRGSSERTRRATHLLLAATGLQAALGVATLVYKVPVPLGAAHQVNALLLLGLSLFVLHES